MIKNLLYNLITIETSNPMINGKWKSRDLQFKFNFN